MLFIFLIYFDLRLTLRVTLATAQTGIRSLRIRTERMTIMTRVKREFMSILAFWT